MSINQELSTLTPHETAEAVNVGVQSIRRWCEWHAIHLSPGASPGPGVPRRLVARDVEVLKVVKDLRYQGLQTEAINERLKTMAFPEIADKVDSESAITLPINVETQTTLQESPSNDLATIVALNDLQTQIKVLERVQEEIKRSRQRDFLLVMMGVVIGVLLVVGLLAMAALIMR